MDDNINKENNNNNIDKIKSETEETKKEIENKNLNSSDDDFVIGKNFNIPEFKDDTDDIDTAAEQPQKPQTVKDRKNNKKTEKFKKKRSRRSRKRLKSLITLFIVVSVSVIIALLLMFFSCEYLGIGLNKDGSNCTVDIKQGYSTGEIADELKKAKAINSKFMFNLYCRISGVDKTFKYGVYNFTNELGYKDLAELLQKEGKMDNVVSVTIPERANVDDIIKLLEKNGVCTKSDFKNAMENGNYKGISIVEDIPVNKVYYRFEGYLYPDTYNFYTYDSKECAELAIKKMLTQMDKVWTEKYKAEATKRGYTVHDILTMASIVELEASASTNEMPKVAQVFYNRLNWDEPKLLGSSPTQKYPYGNGRYDTNKTEGLPPGPLCSPSLSAIKAALFPDTSVKATYFVTDSDNVFYYNDSYAAHIRTINELKSKGKWIG